MSKLRRSSGFSDDTSTGIGEGVAFGDDTSTGSGEGVFFGDTSTGLGEGVFFGEDTSIGLDEGVFFGDDTSAGVGEGVFFVAWPDAFTEIAMLAIASTTRKQRFRTKAPIRAVLSRRYRDLRECNENIKWNRWSCQRGMP